MINSLIYMYLITLNVCKYLLYYLYGLPELISSHGIEEKLFTVALAR